MNRILLALVFISSSPFAFADDLGFFNELFRPNTSTARKMPTHRVSYEFQQYPARAVENKGTNIRVRKQNLSAFSLLDENDSEKYMLVAGLSSDEYDTPAHIPVTNESVPSALLNPNVTGVYSKNFEKGSLSSTFSISSPSDKPYSAWDVLGLQSNLIYRLPSEKNSYLWMLNWSNTRAFLNWIPLPGFAYLWNYSDTFKALLGFPFLGLWSMPFEKVTFNAYYFPLTTGQIKISYTLFGPANIYMMAKSETKTYLLFDRKNQRDRLFSTEKSLLAGFVFPVSKSALLEMNGGYSFDRKIYIAEKQSSKNTSRQLNFVGSGFGTIKLGVAF